MTTNPSSNKPAPMSAEERAKKIIEIFEYDPTGFQINWTITQIREAEQSIFERTRQECLEWCMAFRRDDGTSQKIEEKIRAIRWEDL